MRYLRINVDPPATKPVPWLARLLGKLLPAANPDLEGLFDQAQIWWLEVDDAGRPQREIGFDKQGTAIVLGPVGRNYGFLVDSNDNWKDYEGDSDEAARDFQKTWNTLWAKFEHLER